MNVNGKLLPAAKMRVPSALGVSAEIVALPEPAAVDGDAQLIDAVELLAAFNEAAPALPAAFVPAVAAPLLPLA
ncbi:hypothetical protein [Paraburkholderia sp. GAS199]|uniref:hypothetical protein n=1 Tax=Paraburkholderia sp. GAS199 TaxID=3035126 RepID=UPI003D20A30D